MFINMRFQVRTKYVVSDNTLNRQHHVGSYLLIVKYMQINYVSGGCIKCTSPLDGV